MSHKWLFLLEFPTKDLLDEFASWLSNSGEQQYFECLDIERDRTPSLDVPVGSFTVLAPDIFVYELEQEEGLTDAR